MAWQKHNAFDILPQEDKTFLEDLVRAHLRVGGIKGGHFMRIHDEAWSVVPIAAVDVKRAWLKKPYTFFWNGAAGRQGRKPLKVLGHFLGTFLLVPVVCLYEF